MDIAHYTFSTHSLAMGHTTRGYQQEMLDESLKRNIVIAMDTGSGKTHIALLRMKIETEQSPLAKISWFLAPTVTLCEQQHRVIADTLPVPVGLITSALEPNQWTDNSIWNRILGEYRILVSTPQVLLDALRHGYVNLGQDIGLLVFDEAHHAVDRHPYNLIMSEFYFPISPAEAVDRNTAQRCRPFVLGLTASPMFGGNVEQAFKALERNLDCTISAPFVCHDELESYVSKPVLKFVLHASGDHDIGTRLPDNLYALKTVLRTLDINDDPYVISLRRKLAILSRGSDEWRRVDQLLSKVVLNQGSHTHRALRQFERAAEVICFDVGVWAANWYIESVVEGIRNPSPTRLSAWSADERTYLLRIINQIELMPESYDATNISSGISDKTDALIQCLQTEKTAADAEGETFNCLLFVARRDTVVALAAVLSRHPETADLFNVGCLFGASDSSYRQSLFESSLGLHKKSHADALRDFRLGKKSVLVSTAVAEEGLDIPSCGCVVRWDPPSNMVSWMQSRGRARRKRSTFILMFDTLPACQASISVWQTLEKEMVIRYSEAKNTGQEAPSTAAERDPLCFCVQETGALLTLDSAVGHLAHFCASISDAPHRICHPIYQIDPPDFPDTWHSQENVASGDPPLYEGPWGCSVTLPRILDQHLRRFTTPREHRTKYYARQHAAFNAYRGLYDAGLLNQHLLPLFAHGGPELDEEVKELLKDIEKRHSTAGVSQQINPWSPDEGQNTWYAAELSVDGLPSLRMFTRSRPIHLAEADFPILHHPGYGPLTAHFRAIDNVHLSQQCIANAREYTRRLFWIHHGGRMKWENVDFAYLFLPSDDVDDSHWEARRLWSHGLHLRSERLTPFTWLFANAQEYGCTHSWPEDFTSVSFDGGPFGRKQFRFLRWRFEVISPEQEDMVRKQHRRGRDNPDVRYPLLEVEPLNHLKDFLKPSSPPDLKRLFLLPQYCIIHLMSSDDIGFATLLPSILRSLAISTTVISFRDMLFAKSSLSQIPLNLLIEAMTAPSSQSCMNYQRLESLGDAVLKLITSLNLLCEHPQWPEGYLSKAKDHIVSNARLAKNAINHKLYRWIIRDRHNPRKWRPLYLASSLGPDPTHPSQHFETTRPRSTASHDQLSTKILADVVESLIGAAYLFGGFDLAIETAELFDHTLSWQKMHIRIGTILAHHMGNALCPYRLNNVESMLSYQFHHKPLLIEACTHATHQCDSVTPSYERLEFLGDAVLDLIVIEYLYHTPGKNYSPGHIHMRKIAVVNAQFLSFICLRCFLDINTSMPRPGDLVLEARTQRVYLWQCLLHASSAILDAQSFTLGQFRKFQAEIENALRSGTIFPWAALARLQAPKIFSDMVESLLGAVFLDSGGNRDVVREVLRTLGILPILERLVRDDVDVLHPVTRMSNWASKRSKKVEYVVEKQGGKISCRVLCDGEEVIHFTEDYRGKTSERDVKLQAAEDAFRLLQEVL